jgi:hypothetical protein
MTVIVIIVKLGRPCSRHVLLFSIGPKLTNHANQRVVLARQTNKMRNEPGEIVMKDGTRLDQMVKSSREGGSHPQDLILLTHPSIEGMIGTVLFWAKSCSAIYHALVGADVRTTVHCLCWKLVMLLMSLSLTQFCHGVSGGGVEGRWIWWRQPRGRQS